MEKIDCKMYLKAKENNDYRVIKYLLRKYPDDCMLKYDYLMSLIKCKMHKLRKLANWFLRGRQTYLKIKQFGNWK